jgi:hypothetical protein
MESNPSVSQPRTLEMVEFVKAHGGNALYWINLTELPEVISCCKTTKS